ncbi:MAG: Mur ligase domain-containing protein, partial [Burkholderiaceae bacterium]
MKAQEILSWLSRHVASEAHLCLDTRQLQAGDVFFACPGLTSDGRLYIQRAVELGAAAVVVHGDGAAAPRAAVPVLVVDGLA